MACKVPEEFSDVFWGQFSGTGPPRLWMSAKPTEHRSSPPVNECGTTEALLDIVGWPRDRDRQRDSC